MVSRFRWYDLVPEAVLALGLGLFAVTEPSAAGSAFKSSKALLLMAIVGAGWLAARVLSLVVGRWPIARLALFTIAALMILRVVVLPAYDNKTVIETLEPAKATAKATAVETVRIASGSLAGIDHRAEGDVNVYRRSDDTVVVGLESIDIQPGPAYALYLVPGSGRDDPDGGTRLAALRGNRGTQFYDAPPSLDLTTGAWTVLVWCETFDVPVAHASPT